ncbi:hypothetical protein Flavo103_25910 [Flavobacterium collinsii]|nr:hypothetical protein Flavo103_25910 [Flavobacterium collinsii]
MLYARSKKARIKDLLEQCLKSIYIQTRLT